MKTIIRISLILSILAIAVPASAQTAGATLTIGQGNGHIGTFGVVVPISLTSSSGINVAALNFDIQFDATKLAVLDVTLGAAAAAAAKEVHFATPTTGTLRVVIYGINQNRIGNGVIANAVFDVAMSVSEGTIPLTLANVVAASPEATAVPATNVNGSVVIAGQATSFADVMRTHWAYGYIEALYRGGFISGCQIEPKRLFCVNDGLTRAQIAVFVLRGVHGATYTPTQPTAITFSDTPLSHWGAKWAKPFFEEGYTAGCGTTPSLIFCPDVGHLREEWPVYMERMLHGVTFAPPTPTTQHYTDVLVDRWSYKWIEAAVSDQLPQECEDPANRGDTLFRPMDITNRAEAACVMSKAKGLTPVTP